MAEGIGVPGGFSKNPTLRNSPGQKCVILRGFHGCLLVLQNYDYALLCSRNMRCAFSIQLAKVSSSFQTRHDDRQFYRRCRNRELLRNTDVRLRSHQKFHILSVGQGACLSEMDLFPR